jgi:hypothetical protein
MCGSKVQDWHNVHNETPFFVSKEAHEEYKTKRRPDKRPDPGIASETERDEYCSGHEKTREQGREIGPERR